MKYSVQLGSMVLLIVLAGCESNHSAGTEGSVSQSSIENSVTTDVIARVDDSNVTEEQLELAISRTLGETAAFISDPNINRKILDSLVASRAMALEQEKSMSDEMLAELELKVQAYREELLVKAYIQQQAQPEPVTPAMVSAYYKDHPEEFGGQKLKTFEVISTYKQPKEEQQRAVAKAFREIDQKVDWQQSSRQMKSEAFPVRYQKLTMQVDLLEQPMRSLVESTAPGQVSPLNINGQLMRVKVISQQQLPPKPLQEVAAEIRQKLAPIRFRKKVRELSRQALEKVSVTYISR